MKAAIINAYGGPEVIEIADIPRPTVASNEVLIRSAAGGFNPADAAIRSGAMKNFLPLEFPYTLGAETAGVVEELGSAVTTFALGDRVFAYVNMFKRGSLSEFVAVDAALVAKAPRSITLLEAAVVPAVALTAWQALFIHADLQAGQRVLIVGASGGVGSMAVQLAKWKRAQVIGVASNTHETLVRSLGANEFIDYRAGSLAKTLTEKVDVIFNLSGVSSGEVTAMLSLLRPGGILVTATSPADAGVAQSLGVRAHRMASQPNGAQLAVIADLIDAGAIKPVLSSQRALDDVAALHREGGASYGRAAVVIDEALARR